MSKGKWIISTGILLILSLMITGYFAIAAEYGSQDDPLVSLSYITDVLSPDTIKKLEDTVSEKVSSIQSDLDTRINDYENSLDEKLAGFEKRYSDAALDDEFMEQVAALVAKKLSESGKDGAGAYDTPSAGASWQVVKVESGKTVMLPLGCEAVLRIGSGTCYSTGTVGLVNLTKGTTAANGDEIAANNLYLVTIDSGRGIKASSDMTILIKGSYTIQ